MKIGIVEFSTLVEKINNTAINEFNNDFYFKKYPEQPSIESLTIGQNLSDDPPAATEKIPEKFYQTLTFAWIFARKMLWPTIQFSREREDKIKKLLINYFHPGEKWKNRLMIDMNSFCERILLVKKYLEKDVCRFVPVPEKFFDPYFESGFIGTEKWLKNVQLKRKENKLFYYNHRLLILCFRNYGNDPNINNYNKGRKLLSRKKCDWLLDEYDKLVMGISELNNDRNYLYKKYVLNNYE